MLLRIYETAPSALCTTECLLQKCILETNIQHILKSAHNNKKEVPEMIIFQLLYIHTHTF